CGPIRRCATPITATLVYIWILQRVLKRPRIGFDEKRDIIARGQKPTHYPPYKRPQKISRFGKPPPPVLYPDAAIGIPVDDPIICQRIIQFQQRFLKDVFLADRFIRPVTKFHVTLCTASISDSDKRTFSVKVLNEAKKYVIPEAFRRPIKNARVHIRGLEMFNELHGIYVKVDSSNIDLNMLRTDFADIFKEMSCPLSVHNDIDAHIMIFKTFGTFFNPNYIREVWDKFRHDANFGIQRVKSIQVLGTAYPIYQFDGIIEFSRAVELAERPSEAGKVRTHPSSTQEFSRVRGQIRRATSLALGGAKGATLENSKILPMEILMEERGWNLQ
ncbi:hypothetical protein BIW11_05851, partial [Tropilaelaps mercedesae]